MGRGVRAAAVMGQLRAAVRAYARLDLAPADVLEFLDGVVRDLGDGADRDLHLRRLRPARPHAHLRQRRAPAAAAGGPDGPPRRLGEARPARRSARGRSTLDGGARRRCPSARCWRSTPTAWSSAATATSTSASTSSPRSWPRSPARSTRSRPRSSPRSRPRAPTTTSRCSSPASPRSPTHAPAELAIDDDVRAVHQARGFTAGTLRGVGDRRWRSRATRSCSCQRDGHQRDRPRRRADPAAPAALAVEPADRGRRLRHRCCRASCARPPTTCTAAGCSSWR